MNKATFVTASLIFYLQVIPVASQQLPPEIQSLSNKVNAFTYSNRHDSAQNLVLQYLQRTNLSETETFYGNYLFADILKSAGRPDDAVKQLEKCKKLLNNISHEIINESLVYGKIAECYFDLQDYTAAKKFALASLEKSPDTSFRTGGHAVNHIILGYSEYRDKKYTAALKYYETAIKEYRSSGETCELPLIFLKMATVFNTMGDKESAVFYLDKAVFISDSCKIENYILLSKRTLFDLYNENKDYKKALEFLLDINELVGKMEKEKNDSLINELEVKYETMLTKRENENLRLVNDKNKEILSEQRTILGISAIMVVVLLIVVALLYRISVIRKKAKEDLAVMNVVLERRVAERTDHLKTANEKIRENVGLLSSQNQKLIDFCNIVSHNLKSPLMNMSVLFEFMAQTANEDERRQILDKIKLVVSRLNVTYGELVESLMVTQDTEIKSEKIRINDCLLKILDELAGDIKKSDAVFEFDFDNAPEISFPKKYLISMLQNLVSNSLKYKSPERKPLVKIQTKKKGNNIILSVSDNGLGIDLSKYKNDIFKLRKVFHEHPEARGFGLYITKTQVDAMGGKMWLESIPDKGTTFYVEFVNQKI